MNILQFTNTFTPHVGGVARSVEQFTAEYRRQGHQVLVVAPEFAPKIPGEAGVVRMPAIQKFNGSDFSVAVPIPGYLNGIIAEFKPQVVHSHHPFVLGDTALRFSAKYDTPMVFTHHTQYEKYTHYVPGDSPAMKRFAIDLAVGYCNLCDAVIAPSETIRDRLEKQGVQVRIADIPTGVDISVFGDGDGRAYRQQLGIPWDAFVVGHVGRLAPEKGLDFLAAAVARFLQRQAAACFLVVGSGPSTRMIEKIFQDQNLSERLYLPGQLDRPQLAAAYAAMDVFAFASQSETQGMVLTEAMAAGTPVIAIDAPGVREVVQSGENGISLAREDAEDFAAALASVAHSPPADRDALIHGARKTADNFSMVAMATKALNLYEELVREVARTPRIDDAWSTARRRIESEWNIWSNVAGAMTHAVIDDKKPT